MGRLCCFGRLGWRGVLAIGVSVRGFGREIDELFKGAGIHGIDIQENEQGVTASAMRGKKIGIKYIGFPTCQGIECRCSGSNKVVA